MADVLAIRGLRLSFDTADGEVRALRGLDIAVAEGELVAVVGESGCGKSASAHAVMHLLPSPPARVTDGSIVLCGHDITSADDRAMQGLRGRVVSMIFQDPMTSLDPTMTVGRQIAEAIVLHRRTTSAEAMAEAVRCMELVRIPDASRRARQYPHEFSGGMRQRVMIAMALSCEPKLLIADEPTTALDVTVQAGIIDLLCDLKRRTGTAVMLITHDLGIVAGAADRVVVMYAGRAVERGTADDIFYSPSHPYTRALLASMPSRGADDRGCLPSIPGAPPDLLAPPVGCAFAPRCAEAMRICDEAEPPTFDASDGHDAACWLLHPDRPRGRAG